MTQSPLKPLSTALVTWGMIIALLAGLLPGFVAAQETVTDAITVTAESAVAEFPNGITFSLNAVSDEPIVEAELFYRPARVETLRLGSPDLTPGTEIALTYEADFRGGRMPPGVDILYSWRLETASGEVLETPEQVVLWADDRFAWQPLEGELVTVYAYNGNPDFNQAILDAAERTIDRLSAAYDAEMDEPIRIWAYNSGQDFVGALAPNSEEWIAGAAYPNLGLIISVLPPGDLDEVGRIVPHEVSHQVLNQATRNPFNTPPVWLDEGLAVQAQETGSEAFARVVAEAAANGQLEPIPVLNSQFPYDAQGALLGYAQSESIVNFITATYGEEGVARLIAVFREGVSYEEAVEQALGVTLDELDALWRESLGANSGQGVAGTENDSSPLGGGSGSGPDFSGLSRVLAMASGTAIMGVVAILAIGAGTIVIMRNRRRLANMPDDPDDPDESPGDEYWREPVVPPPAPVAPRPDPRQHDLLSAM